jgi:putative CocE/NonD family hydrolase
VELPVVAAGERLLDGGAPWFREWVSRPDAADPYWEPRRATAALDRVQSPVLLVSGWQDVFLGQSLEQYARLRARGVDASLLVGAWRHTDPVSTGARIAVRETLRWLARHLATASARPSAPAPVQVELSGGGGWRRLAGWPPASTPLTLQLQPGGGLSADPPPPDAPASAFTFDPDAPTPSVGGPSLALSGGYRDDTELAGRPDVLAFTGGPLDRDLEIAGTVVVELAHRTDVPHADLFVRLCDTDARGRSRNVCEGYLRLPVERSQDAVRLELGAVAHRFAAGHRIRLLVAGGAHPVYARNLGTGEPVATGTRTVSVVHTVAHGPGGTSSVTLPVLSVAAA